jgi:hypothetical protein
MKKHRDILKELRAAPAVMSNIGPPLGRILRDAADEIERLREALAIISMQTSDELMRTTAKRALGQGEKKS